MNTADLMIQKTLFIVLCLFYFLPNSFAQLTGKITGSDGEGLAYATIYVRNTTKGTTSNIEGLYELNLSNGNYEIVFQYVGYEQLIKNISIEEPTTLDIVLTPQEVNLEEVVISADAEDPAYQIIRNAISKREQYREEVEQFTADIYIKGLVKIGDTPEKFLGFNLGDLEGILDTNRQGIVYLSESKSKVYYKAPDQLKEVMFASKVAGNLDGISFNQYADVNFSFYNEHIRFNRNLLSPIADNALRFYKYRLESSYFDEQGFQINKIKVIPKNENDPVFQGDIYIVEDSWRIYTADLTATGVSTKNSLFEKMRFKQIYVPLEGENKWILFSQIMDFSMKFMVFNFDGTFTYFFSDFDLSPIDPKVFSKETFRAEEGANKRDSMYWEEIRPIPITLEEKTDYHKKDSLEVLWNSEAYRDSVDREDNKFKPMNLFLGYTYSNSFKNRYISYISPLNSVQFNPIQGYTLSVDFRYRQWNKKNTEFFMIEPKLNYGFAEKAFRPELKITRRFNSVYYTSLTGGAGRTLRQVNQHNPVSIFLNTYESLLFKKNNLRLYEADFANLQYKTNFATNFTGTIGLEYANRKSVFINTQKSWRLKDELYDANSLNCDACYGEGIINDHSALLFEANILFRPKLTYLSYDERRFNQRSKWPDFILNYKKGMVDVNYDLLKLSVRDERVDLNLWGYFSYNVEIGAFLNNDNLTDLDYYYFNSNETPVILDKDNLSSYKLMPNYEFRADNQFASLFYEYHLEGKLMDKIPVLKNWGLKSVLSYNHAWISEADNYYECSFGVENIGIAGIPVIRLDYVWSFSESDLINRGLILQITQDLN